VLCDEDGAAFDGDIVVVVALSAILFGDLPGQFTALSLSAP